MGQQALGGLGHLPARPTSLGFDSAPLSDDEVDEEVFCIHDVHMEWITFAAYALLTAVLGGFVSFMLSIPVVQFVAGLAAVVLGLWLAMRWASTNRQ